MLRLLALLALVLAGFGCSAVAWSSDAQPALLEPSHDELVSEGGPVAVLAARSSLVQVRRAPAVQRLPAVAAAPAVPLAVGPRHVEVLAPCSRGAGEPCLQIRRRLPRMSSDEPPWS